MSDNDHNVTLSPEMVARCEEWAERAIENYRKITLAEYMLLDHHERQISQAQEDRWGPWDRLDETTREELRKQYLAGLQQCLVDHGASEEEAADKVGWYRWIDRQLIKMWQGDIEWYAWVAQWLAAK